MCGGLEIVRVIGAGGFGIVYLARDPLLGRDVAVKEYMPRRLAVRGEAGRVCLREGARADVYADGLQAFMAEARLLARFEHPSLVRVYRFWEDNTTAYMAMPRLEGMTLYRARRRSGRLPDAGWIGGLLDAVLQALELLHGAGVLHRDVSPDNILLPPDGPPVLLDMGAAQDLGAKPAPANARAAFGMVKQGYAPIEQYRRDSTLQQGPWTDLYGLGAVLHFVCLGKPPLPPQQGGFDRRAERPAEALAGEAAEIWSLMAWMLELDPERRPRSVAEIRERWPASGRAGARAPGTRLAGG